MRFPPTLRRTALALLAAAGCVVALVVTVPPRAQAAQGSVCGPNLNPIACENQQPGVPPEVWDIEGAGSESIQGFSTDISVDAGASLDFKIKTDATAYTIDVYRLGYYGGAGARFVTRVPPAVPLPQPQPACATDPSTLNVDCGTWAVSATWAVPAAAVSGVYIAKLTRTDQGAAAEPDASHITFIVRNDSSTSDIVFQTSDQTWQAYNTYGGSDFYTGTASLTGTQARAFAISYNRPFATRGAMEGRDFLFSNEYPTIRYLEQNGYDVSYISGVDTDRYGATILPRHKVFLSVGHDEYWSLQQRTNVENARDAGVSLMFLSGNEVYWRTLFAPSIDGTSTDYRTLVCTKDTWDGKQIDPDAESTATWRDPRFAAAPGGGRPENALTGTLYMSNNTDLPITVTQAEGKLRLWRGTGLADMTAPQTELAPHTVGYESDEDLDNGFRPAGLIRLSTTTGYTPQYLMDFGKEVAEGTTTHHLTLYRAASGALVFGAGTVQWGWGLDAHHDGNLDDTPADPRMRQATTNMLADMGAQPTTLAPDLRPASPSTDTAAPTATITSPAAGATIANGAVVTVTGTASDSGGGVVAGVEVSLDGGQSWHPADGAASWSYTGPVHGAGPSAIMARATDDSANMQSPGTALPLEVACPCTLFGSTVPGAVDGGDSSPAELGMRFSSAVDGYVTGVRFYKSAANTGTHVGTLWDSAGVARASGTFVDETAEGWQTLQFAAPVPITAGTEYVVSYSAPNGRYSADGSFFYYRPTTAAPLSAPATVPGGTVNGVYSTRLGAFPTATYRGANYYVDPVFVTGAVIPPSVASHTPPANAASVPASLAPTATFSKAIDPATLSFTLAAADGQPVSGAVAYDAAARKATFTPSAPLAEASRFTAAVSAVDVNGNPMAAPATWSFETAYPGQAGGVCPCTLFPEDSVPATPSMSDPAAVELGVKFTADTDGIVTGVRFYKGPQNIGRHTGSLWTVDGELKATGVFEGESAQGWQTLLFATPVPVTAGSVYVASYLAPSGRYAATPGGLAAAIDRFPLHTPARAGLYTYGGGFPRSASTADYGVDVLFTVPNSVVPAVTAASPADGASSVLPTASVSATFSTSVVAGSAAVTLTGPDGPVAGTTVLDPLGKVLTFSPAELLVTGAQYTATISGARSLAGIVQTAPAVVTFTVAGGGDVSCPCSLFPETALPAKADSGDGAAVTVGTQFIPLTSGYISGIRFYKSAANSGVHTGSIWAADGRRLASVTFEHETATGWQTASLDAPLPVTAGATYVVGYFAPNGHYAYTGSYFATQYTSGPLTVPPGNGRFVYGSDAFPTTPFGNSNYWVDVLFNTGAAPPTTPPTIAATTPLAGASSVPASTVPSVRFSKPVDPASVSMTVATADGAPVAGSTAYAAGTATATWTPAAALSAATRYTVAVGAADAQGTALAGMTTWSFTTQAPPPEPGVCPCVLWGDDAAPADINHDDRKAVEVGVRFTADTDGIVTGVRFYKGAQNTGLHKGSVWDSAGRLLAQATFQNESSTGWQAVSFASPVPVAAGQTYTASYSVPVGFYSVTGGQLGSGGFHAAPLHVIPNGGAYVYGAGYPANPSSANYWVTPVFQPGAAPPDTTAPVITAVAATAAPGAATITWTTDEPATSVVAFGTSPDALTSSAGGPDGLAHSVALTGLASGTTYHFEVRSADPAGNVALAAGAFTTPDAAAPIITAVSAAPAPGAATITWTTDEPSTSAVLYGAGTGPLSSTASGPAGTAHSVTLTGLASGGSYRFQVRSVDAAGNSAAAPAEPASFTVPDTTAPVVIAISATAAPGSATVAWTTDEPSTSTVLYGTSPSALTGAAQGADGVTSHAVTIGGLASGATYYYRVRSSDAAGNTTTAPAAAASVTTPDVVAPAISAVAATAAGTTATITWTTDEPSTSQVSFGTAAVTLGSTATAPGLVTAHSVQLSGLAPMTRYYFRVASADAAGNSTTSPAPLAPAASFAPAVAPIADTTAAHFTAGSRSSTTVSDYEGGELLLSPATSADFAGTSLPSGFASAPVVSGGATTVSGGNATVLGARLSTSATYTSGRSLDARATLKAGQSLGWVSSGNANVRAVFSVDSSARLVAIVSSNGSSTATTVLATGWTAAERNLRIDWTSSAVAFFVDGAQVHTRAYTPSLLYLSHRAVLTGPVRTDGGLVVDYLRLAPYAASGTFTSRVLDAGAPVAWDALTWDAAVPAGTTMTVRVRTGTTAAPGSSWSPWRTITAGTLVGTTARYLQYEVTFGSSGSRFAAPVLRSVQAAAHL